MFGLYHTVLYLCVVQLEKTNTLKIMIMRIEFTQVETRYRARKECPWASVITKVVDGYMCFESRDDYNTWKKQK